MCVLVAQLRSALRSHDHCAHLSMKFPKHYWSGSPFSSLGDLPYPGIKPVSPTLQADSLPSQPPEKPMMEVGECLLGVKKALIVFVTWMLSTPLLILLFTPFCASEWCPKFFSKGYRLLNKSSLVWCFYGCTVGSQYLWVPHPKIQPAADWKYVEKNSIKY